MTDEISPLIKNFVNKHLTWTHLCRHNYSEEDVLLIFEKEVIKPSKKALRSFRTKSKARDEK